MKKFISRQCRAVGDTCLVRQLKMRTIYYLSAWENKEKETPRNTSIQVTETIKFVKAINIC